MNQKQLTQAISEGIDESFPVSILKGIFYGLVISVIGAILIMGFFWYQDYKWEKEVCGEDGCPISMAQARHPCEDGGLEILTCHVIDRDIEEEKKINRSIENWRGKYKAPLGLCGYQEANAWFEQYKNKVGGNLYLECK